MSTNGAYSDEMNEVALFTDALRAAVPARPDPGLRTTLVPRLAQAARAATFEAETRPSRPATRRRPWSRRALVGRVAIAVAAIPLAFAGLAFAGVTVPSPARDAFDAVGIALPNQPSDKTAQKSTEDNAAPAAEQETGNDVSEAAQSKEQGAGGNSEAAHEHARQQREKAKGKAVGHDRGKAVGLNETTPPGHSGETGPPPHSNAGGSSGGHSQGTPKSPSAGKTKPPTAHVPKGVGQGLTKIPPGRSK
jgi:hypothetical protein